MKLVVLSDGEGWRWRLLDFQGRTICSSCQSFHTAPLALQAFSSAKSGMLFAHIVDSKGRPLEQAFYEIHYVQ